MVDEFHAILQEYCRIEKVWMPKNYLNYLEKSFDAIENEILGPSKDWSKVQIIDTGANLNHFLFDKDRDATMERNKKFGVQKVIQWCSSMRASVKAAENGQDAMIGWTPGDSEETFDLEYLTQALKDHKFVAIKAGLDYRK